MLLHQIAGTFSPSSSLPMTKLFLRPLAVCISTESLVDYANEAGCVSQVKAEGPDSALCN